MVENYDVIMRRMNLETQEVIDFDLNSITLFTEKNELDNINNKILENRFNYNKNTNRMFFINGPEQDWNILSLRSIDVDNNEWENHYTITLNSDSWVWYMEYLGYSLYNPNNNNFSSNYGSCGLTYSFLGVINNTMLEPIENCIPSNITFPVSLDFPYCNSDVAIQELSTKKSLIKTIDILGRETTNKGFQLHIYDDGFVEKKYVIE